jgi:hypothetical protein
LFQVFDDFVSRVGVSARNGSFLLAETGALDLARGSLQDGRSGV